MEAIQLTFDKQTGSLKRALNAGFGPYATTKLHSAFERETWQEIRIDIDPRAKPDLVLRTCDPQSRRRALTRSGRRTLLSTFMLTGCHAD